MASSIAECDTGLEQDNKTTDRVERETHVLTFGRVSPHGRCQKSFVFYSKSQSNGNFQQFRCLAIRETQCRIQNTEKRKIRQFAKLPVLDYLAQKHGNAHNFTNPHSSLKKSSSRVDYCSKRISQTKSILVGDTSFLAFQMLGGKLKHSDGIADLAKTEG